MNQDASTLMGRIDGPDTVPRIILGTAETYREVVRLCWALRKVAEMKPIDLARSGDLTRQHVSDYLNDDDLPTRRDLPARQIAVFERVCGNSAITQWLAARQKLTVLEEVQADRRAA